jgi:hypothetical protein
MYEELLPIIAPVVICTAVGYAWTRLRQPMDSEFMTRIIMNVGMPCLILQGIGGLPAGAPGLLYMVGLGALVHGGCLVLGAAGLRLLGQPVRSYLPAIGFSNSTNLGLPLCMFAFGDEGLGLGVGYVLVGAVGMFVLAPLIQGREPPWRTLARTPVVYASALALALLVSGAELPEWVANTVGLFGALAVPLMLLALGQALATMGVQSLRAAAGIAVARLALGFVLAGVLSAGLELGGALRGTLLIQSSMPVAVFSYIFAARYERHPQDVAGAVVVSTLLAFLLLPALLLYALRG